MAASQSITYDIPTKCQMTCHSETTGHIVASCIAVLHTHIKETVSLNMLEIHFELLTNGHIIECYAYGHP
jgi:hypothetical protein